MSRLRHVVVTAAPPVFALAFVGFWLMAEIGRFAAASPDWWLATWLPIALVGASIALGRLLPIASLAIVAVLLIGQLLGVIAPLQSTSWPVYFGLLVTAALVSWSGSRGFLAWVLIAFAGFSVLLAAQVTGEVLRSISEDGAATDSGPDTPQAWLLIAVLAVLFFALALCCWFLGFAQRLRRERADALARRLATESELADSELEVMLASERDRIAQDVHDIMAHSLSVIAAQADGARYLSEARPEATGTALEAIASSARGSLVEVRMLMDALSSEPQGHSQPGVDDLGELIGRMGAAGLPVTMDAYGAAGRLSSAQELAVYRIVQESLTNALRHAGPDATARVGLDWRGPGLALTIASRGNQAATATPDGYAAEVVEGRGIRGMRERARLSGGWLSAGAEAGEGEEPEFIVTANLPILSTDAASGEGD